MTKLLSVTVVVLASLIVLAFVSVAAWHTYTDHQRVDEMYGWYQRVQAIAAKQREASAPKPASPAPEPAPTQRK